MDTKDIVAAINKKYGKETVVKNILEDIEVIPTGCINLDLALGVGGIPTQRITEYYGVESAGKTTLALQAISNCQAMGKIAVYIDAEQALDRSYAIKLGVDMDNLILVQPDTAETALNIICDMFSDFKENLGIVVLDSVPAMIPKAEADSEVGDASVGLHARLLSSFIRRIQPMLKKSNAALLLINQQRAKIGGMTGFGGPTTTTPGGYALKHGTSVRVELTRTGNIQSTKDGVTGIKVQAQTRKNKVAPPYQKTDFEIYFGLGTSIGLQTIDYAVKYGIIKKSGSWFKYGDQSIGQGLGNSLEYLREHNLLEAVFDAVMRNITLPEQVVKIYREKLEMETINTSDGENSDDD